MKYKKIGDILILNDDSDNLEELAEKHNVKTIMKIDHIQGTKRESWKTKLWEIEEIRNSNNDNRWYRWHRRQCNRIIAQIENVDYRGKIWKQQSNFNHYFHTPSGQLQ